MGDEKRNEGNGAVVAIVLILGIVALLGVVVVVGGAFLFLARSDTLQIQMPPSPTVSAPALPPIAPETADLESVEVQPVKPLEPSN